MIELLLQAERALSVGLLDRADVLYSQVARADPRNSIAVVGLARVTLDRGDDIGALELARKALAIDPENNAAQRMVARLEEVLDFRDAARDLDQQPAVAEAAAVSHPSQMAELAEPPKPVVSQPLPEVAAAEPPEVAAVNAGAEAAHAEPVEPTEPQAIHPLPVPAAIKPATAGSLASPEPAPAQAAAEVSATVPVPEAAERPPEPPAAEPVSSPSREAMPAEPRRRSWLDRLFGRP